MMYAERVNADRSQLGDAARSELHTYCTGQFRVEDMVGEMRASMSMSYLRFSLLVR